MRNRHRWIYHMTGLPGWLRYGFSPFWRGRNPANTGYIHRYFGPGTAPPYLHMTKYTPQERTPASTGQNATLPGFSSLYDPWGMAVLTPEEELNFMKIEAEQLEDQLFTIEKRIKELEEKE